MLSDDDNLGIYDDLDEFQEAEDHKSKELLAWEVKHRNALTEIEDLKARNLAMEKKIKTMEVNLQNLLDTAKSEVKRKEELIAQLRKEKDDICFRRKRGREDEELAEIESEKKRVKAAPRVDPEVKTNPFKADSKNDAKSVGKRRSRSKSPRSRSKIKDHRRETGRKSRERRRSRSRSRSPRHSSRQEEHRSRGSNFRRRSRSPLPRQQAPGSKTQKNPSLAGEEKTNSREIGRKPHHEKAMEIQVEIAAPITPSELSTPKAATKKAKSPTIKCKSNGHTPFESNNSTSTEERIPGLDIICDPAAHKRELLQCDHPEIKSKEILPKESVTSDPTFVHKEETKNAKMQIDANAIELSKPKTDLPIKNTNYEPSGTDAENNGVEKSAINDSINKLTKDHTVVQAEAKAELLVASATDQRHEDLNCNSAGGLFEPKSDGCDDIELPKVADIGNMTVIVDEQCDGPEEVTKTTVSDEQNNPSGKVVDCSNPCNSEGNISVSELKEPTTSSSSSTVLYAQPDSTKIDHNDRENEISLETALNLVASDDLVPPTPSAPNQNYSNLSLEEDAIEKALGQLHQTLSPDETVVTSTSNRARKAEDNCVLISTNIRHSPVHPKEPTSQKTSTNMENTDDSQPQISRVLEMEPPSPCQDITIDETVDEGSSIPNEDVSTVTKRCSLGHTDYQFEQRNDEIILRVKRHTRRRCLTPLEVQVPNPPPTGAN